MGEIAEMMLDGDLCEGCGVYMGGPGRGVPRRCADCRKPSPRPLAKVKCPTCGKQVKAAGLADHQRDAHGKAAVATDAGPSSAYEAYQEALVRLVEADGLREALGGVTASFVGLVLLAMEHAGHSPDGEIRIDGGTSRDITIHAQKEPSHA